MNIISLICVAVIAVILVLMIKERPEITVAISVMAGVIIIGGSIAPIKNIADAVSKISSIAGVDGKYLETVFKVSGIAIAVNICSSICKDAGQSAIAAKVEIAGRAAIIAAALPIINNLFNVIVQVIK